MPRKGKATMSEENLILIIGRRCVNSDGDNDASDSADYIPANNIRSAEIKYQRYLSALN